MWHYAGIHPYCTFHQLDENFVPLGGGEPVPPPYPARLRGVLKAFAFYSHEVRLRVNGIEFEEDRERPAGRRRE